MNGKYRKYPKHHVVLMQKIKHEQGRTIPVLYIQDGDHFIVSATVVNYLANRLHYSETWKREFVRTIGFFFDYYYVAYDKHKNQFGDIHRNLMTGFINALLSGTIDPETGRDKLGLFWPTTTLQTVKKNYRYLSDFIGWCTDQEWVKRNNDSKFKLSSRETTPIRFLNRAIKIKKYQIQDQYKNLYQISQEIKFKQTIHPIYIPNTFNNWSETNPLQFKFPPELVEPLFMYGFIKENSINDIANKYDLNAYMISALLFFTGPRVSEPFQLWYNDVSYINKFECEVTLRHPSLASTFILGEEKTRYQYLLERNMTPRQNGSGNYRSGWKNLKTDQHHQAPCYFIHDGIEAMFRQMYEHYIKEYRKNMMQKRIERGEIDHPFLFVSSGFDGSSSQSYEGNPFTIDAYKKKFKTALDRTEKAIGEKIPRGKKYGTTPHGARHYFANLLVEAGVSPTVMQNALRHRSIFSQEAYTAQGYKDLLNNLKSAKERLSTLLHVGG